MKNKYRIKQHIVLTDKNNVTYKYSVEQYISNIFVFNDWKLITNYEPISKEFLFSSSIEAEETLIRYLNFKKQQKEIKKQDGKIIKTFKL